MADLAAMMRALRRYEPTQEDVARAMERRQSVMYDPASLSPEEREAERIGGWRSASGQTPEEVRGARGLRALPASQGQVAQAMNWSSLAPFGITVYHGSPHQFTKFDMSKIGTGEGAQAYGHGLYFAENPNVAAGYAENLKTITRGGKVLEPVNVSQGGFVSNSVEANAAELIAKNGYKTVLDDAISAAKADPGNPWLAEHLDAVRSLKNVPVSINKHLYKVDIPDEHVAKMLDWDKPLSQQPESVQNVLAKIAADYGATNKAWQMYSTKEPDWQGLIFGGMEATGDQALRSMTRRFGDKATSEMLRNAGIPGIRYLDQGSRGAGAGTSNFVVFDEKLPKILGRIGDEREMLMRARERALKGE